MSDRRKPSPGDLLHIDATEWGEVLDAKEWVKRQRERSGSTPTHFELDDPCLVWVKNTSGASRPRFSVLGIDASSIFPSPETKLDAFKNGPVIRGVVPTISHAGRFVILQSSALENGIVRGVILGATVAKVNFLAAGDRFAEVDPGNTAALRSGNAGSAKILYQPLYPGEQWTLVLIGGGGAGELPRVLFQIQSFDEYSGAAVCVPKWIPCDGSLPGVKQDGTIDVFDPAGCNFNEPPEELIGRWGWADWLINAEYPTECMWICSGLCCPPIEPLAE